MNWDDLKYVLAIHRGGTLSDAARRLGIDQTTVSRRLRGLEHRLGAALFLRAGGRMLASDLGEAVTRRAERVEAEMIALDADLAAGGAQAAGTVRLTTVPIIANRLLVPRLAGLLGHHPGLLLELGGEPRNLSLGKREADVALRLARPEKGVMLCRRLGTLGYSVYGAAAAPAGGNAAAAPWLDYDESLAHLPQARWLRRRGVSRAPLRVGDAETLLAAVRAGHGQAVLPDFAAGGEPGLRVLGDGPVLTRDVWLLVHPDMRPLPRIAAVLDWMHEIFTALPVDAEEQRKETA